MTTLMRRGFASTLLGAAALFFVGCGGGSSGPTPNATATPGGTPNGTVTPTSGPVGDGRSVAVGEVVFVSNRANPALRNSDLYKLTTNGTVVRLTNLGKVIDKPSVSSNGERIVFQFEDTYTADNGQSYTDTEIGLIRADGGNLGNGQPFQQLTTDTETKYANGRPNDDNPVFSPGDQYIYWSSHREDAFHIWRMDGYNGTVGTGQIKLINQVSAFPSVASNGNIAYVDYTVAGSPIAISNSNGTLIKRIPVSFLTSSQIADVGLSPDSKYVAFSSTDVVPSETKVELLIYNVETATAVASSPQGSNTTGGSAWRDSNTLFYDVVTGLVKTRQIVYTLTLPNALFGGRAELNTGQGSSYSPAFLPFR